MDLSGNYDEYTARAAAGSFSEPAPPGACYEDALGNCAVVDNSTQSGQCYVGVNAHGIPIYLYNTVVDYRVYTQRVVSGAIKTTSLTPAPHCIPSVSWYPEEPKVQYNDSTLP